MEETVYVLCATTALACGLVLLRGWRRSRVRLLLWCALFFLTLAVENAILFVDLAIVPTVDLSPIRNSLALAGVLVFLVGVVWETR